MKVRSVLPGRTRALLAILMAAAALVAPAAASTPPPAAAAAGDPVLTLTGSDGGQVALTMADLQALPVFTGRAGSLDTIGRPSGPHVIKGVRLADLFTLVAYQPRCPVTVWSYHPEFPSPDDYKVTLTASQVGGHGVTVYKTTPPYARTSLVAGDTLVPVIAYEEDGQPVAPGPDGDGPLRFWYAWQPAAGAGYLVDAGVCVRWVDRLVVNPAPPDWTLRLRRGARTVRISRDGFAVLAARWGRSVRVGGHDFRGVPLFRLVGRVDGGGSGFDARLAAKGYAIDLRTADGRRVTISSKLISGRPAGVLVAWQRDGGELSGAAAPLVFTGAVAAAKRLAGVTSITLRVAVK